MAKFQSTKTYGTDRGLSCCFRQWRSSHSHCSTLHGYSLGFKFVWESESLDSRNWVFDFGGMKPIKQYLDYMFDHTILVSEDDPALETFKLLASFSTNPEWDGKNDHIGYQEPAPHTLGRVCDLRIVPGVGCELTAKLVYDKSVELLEEMKKGNLGRYDVNPDVRLVSVECFEHSSNSAVYYGDEPVRKTFEIDVGDMSHEEAFEYLKQVKTEIHQRRFPSYKIPAYRDPSTFTAEEIAESERMWREENIVKPTSKINQQIELLHQEPNPAVEDLKYWHKKLLRMLRIPSSK